MHIRKVRVTMNKKARIFLAIFVSAIIIIRISSLVYGIVCLAKTDLSKKCFSSLNDFDKLAPFEIGEIKDNELSADEPINWGYSKKIKWENHYYKVYAYEFTSSNGARNYFLTTSNGSLVEGQIQGYRCSSKGFYDSKYVVFYERYIYRVTGKDYNSFVKFVNWLSEDFETEIIRQNDASILHGVITYTNGNKK